MQVPENDQPQHEGEAHGGEQRRELVESDRAARGKTVSNSIVKANHTPELTSDRVSCVILPIE